MTCKGICSRYKAQKPTGTGRYAAGQARCQICEIFLKVDGIWCPCCGYRLRLKPRNLKYKALLREKNGKKARILPTERDLRRKDLDCPATPPEIQTLKNLEESS